MHAHAHHLAVFHYPADSPARGLLAVALLFAGYLLFRLLRSPRGRDD